MVMTLVFTFLGVKIRQIPAVCIGQFDVTFHDKNLLNMQFTAAGPRNGR